MKGKNIMNNANISNRGKKRYNPPHIIAACTSFLPILIFGLYELIKSSTSNDAMARSIAMSIVINVILALCIIMAITMCTVFLMLFAKHESTFQQIGSILYLWIGPAVEVLLINWVVSNGFRTTSAIDSGLLMSITFIVQGCIFTGTIMACAYYYAFTDES
jgi:hypothetical protein